MKEKVSQIWIWAHVLVVDTLTQREPDSMLAAMFSGRHTLCQDPQKVCMYIYYYKPDLMEAMPCLMLSVLVTSTIGLKQGFIALMLYCQILNLIMPNPITIHYSNKA